MFVTQRHIFTTSASCAQRLPRTVVRLLTASLVFDAPPVVSWRNTAMQERKRQLVAMLSLNSFTYWGDFLDLQVFIHPSVYSQ